MVLAAAASAHGLAKAGKIWRFSVPFLLVEKFAGCVVVLCSFSSLLEKSLFFFFFVLQG